MAAYLNAFRVCGLGDERCSCMTQPGFEPLPLLLAPPPPPEARGGLHIVEQSLWNALPAFIKRLSSALTKHTGGRGGGACRQRTQEAHSVGGRGGGGL